MRHRPSLCLPMPSLPRFNQAHSTAHLRSCRIHPSGSRVRSRRGISCVRVRLADHGRALLPRAPAPGLLLPHRQDPLLAARAHRYHRMMEEVNNGDVLPPNTKTMSLIAREPFEIDEYVRISNILHSSASRCAGAHQPSPCYHPVMFAGVHQPSPRHPQLY